jgi:hypothetical protein
MANDKLIHGEKVLMTSDKNVLTLTNYRVRFDQAATGASNYISICLDCVASCGLVNRSRPLLLVIAAVVGIGGIAQNNNDLRVGSIIAAMILVGAYFITRKAVIAISSNGGEQIMAPVKGMSREATIEFLEALDDARLKLTGNIQ